MEPGLTPAWWYNPTSNRATTCSYRCPSLPNPHPSVFPPLSCPWSVPLFHFHLLALLSPVWLYIPICSDLHVLHRFASQVASATALFHDFSLHPSSLHISASFHSSTKPGRASSLLMSLSLSLSSIPLPRSYVINHCLGRACLQINMNVLHLTEQRKVWVPISLQHSL